MRSTRYAGAAVVVAGALAAGLAAALPAVATTTAPSVSYSFKTLNNSNDETFNQLLGINNKNVISGYYGSGLQGHKNKGYVLLPPYRQADYRVENFPTSAQTQVTGLNDNGVTVGFFSHTNDANVNNNANFGFYAVNDSSFHKVGVPPGSTLGSTPVSQLLGVNDGGVAVGFYVNAQGNARGYRYNIGKKRYSRVNVPGATAVTATAINNRGDVAGFYTVGSGNARSFLLLADGKLLTFAKGTNATQAFGVNDSDEVVGSWTVGQNTYGFTWTPKGGFKEVNDPHGVGSTVINGLNDAGDLVGFYTGSGNRVDGFLATP